MWGRGGDTSTAVIGIGYKARCVAAQSGEPNLNRFLVGTVGLQEQNRIDQLEVSSDVSEITRVAAYNHPHEIWYLTCSPHDRDLLVTGYNTGSGFQGSLWRINEKTQKIEELERLGSVTGTMKSILWDPSENEEAHKIAYLDDKYAHIWDLNSAQETELIDVGGDGLDKVWSGSWNPFLEDQIVTTCGDTIAAWDIRDVKTPTFKIPKAHTHVVRDVDINPNNCYYFVTGGDDGKIKFWDLRKPTDPVKTFYKHAHWAWCVKYNKFDSLVISGGTEGSVNLWDVESLSIRHQTHQTPLTESDRHIKSYEGQEDSVYSVAWSASEQGMDWSTFASLSYDGRVVVNRVPEDTAMRMLNL
eukprot:TRINITY_DN852_c0_g1_i1.p1 TRINITY_DN852_c0_g1~~TRINITY_DN852_c0_g1_i1.p1  ORF type:complete len:357 (+),score=43.06 TRINITY_DN852_c0_g1_i1:1439-2509(+)